MCIYQEHISIICSEILVSDKSDAIGKPLDEIMLENVGELHPR